jgi:hypothetical protein
MKIFPALLQLSSVVLLILSLASTASAAPRLTPLQSAAQELDGTIKKLKIKSIAPELGKVLKLEPGIAEKLLVEEKVKLSTLALAKFAADKTGKPLREFTATTNWEERLSNENLNPKDAVEYLGKVESEVAFAMLDFRQKVRR